MRQPGVEVRGITQPDGTAEFCEVFFNDARCPKDNVVGGVNNGWKVANSTLAFERGQSATTGYRRFEDEFKLLVEQATANGSIADPVIRQRLAEYYTKVQLLRINGLRSLSRHAVGHEGPWRRRARARPTRCSGARCTRTRWSWRSTSSVRRRCSIDTGPAAGSWPGAVRDKRRPGYLVSPMISAFFFSRSETIWGGTSQIQRNIVGERVLGLPKEPS